MRSLLKSWVVKSRAKSLYEAASRDFNLAVYSCVNISRVNNRLCFAVKHEGLFGGPSIMAIDRPDMVCLSDRFNGVIVKDGRIYELVKG